MQIHMFSQYQETVPQYNCARYLLISQLISLERKRLLLATRVQTPSIIFLTMLMMRTTQEIALKSVSFKKQVAYVFFFLFSQEFIGSVSKVVGEVSL